VINEVHTLQILHAADERVVYEACRLTTAATWWHLARQRDMEFHRCDRLHQAEQLHWQPGRSVAVWKVPQEYNCKKNNF